MPHNLARGFICYILFCGHIGRNVIPKKIVYSDKREIPRVSCYFISQCPWKYNKEKPENKKSNMYKPTLCKKFPTPHEKPQQGEQKRHKLSDRPNEGRYAEQCSGQEKDVGVFFGQDKRGVDAEKEKEDKKCLTQHDT